MGDKLVKAIAKNGEVRIVGAITTDLVNEAVKIHDCAATGAAALGRMLTAGSLMGTMLKSDTDSLSIRIDGEGPAKSVIATGYADGHVKGYIGNPQDRKSTRLNSSHANISYAVFCLKKKKNNEHTNSRTCMTNV